MFLTIAGLGLDWTPPATAAGKDDPKARAIMKNVVDRDDGDNQISQMEMILIDKKGKRRKRGMKIYNKDEGENTQSLIFFLNPADVKGTGFLTYDYAVPGKDDDQWLYLPALRKTKRIASSDKSGSFMGSDFNYSDMSEPDLEDYDFTLMKEADVGGSKTWQIQSVPRSKQVAEESGYAKTVVWVRQDNHVIIRALRWIHKSRRMKYMQVSKLEQIDGIWVATESKMVTKDGKRTEHTTILRNHDTRFNQGLTNNLFTVRQLEKGL